MSKTARAGIIQAASVPKRLSALLAALLIAGCGTLAPVSVTPTAERAAAASRRGDHAAAAGMYETVARTALPAERNSLLLDAAREWRVAGRVNEAQRVLTSLGGSLSADQQLQRRLLDADLSLAAGESQRAWQKVTAISAPSAPAAAVDYYDLRLRAALAVARPVDAVRAHLAAVALVSDVEQQRKLRREFLTELRQARDRGTKLDPEASNDVLVRGWLELGAYAGEGHGVSLGGGSGAAQWRARYPGHPAAELLGDVFPAALNVSGNLRRVALLLPLSGRAAGAAAAVRDGFQYGWAQLAVVNRPEISIYDTGAMSVADALAQARATGADFVVGPLTREELAAAAAAGAPPAPLLALNFLPSGQSAPGNWYQFALAPEDEARQIARYLIASGKKRGVALTPNTEWGNRVLNAFSAELQSGGGELVSSGNYDPASADFGGAIRTVLGTDQSVDRLRRVQNAAGTRFEFEPRRRADLQFVLAAAPSPTTARLLRPQLRFQYAGDLPVYSTSDAYAPGDNNGNLDLEGLYITDMPWVVGTGGAVAQTRHAVEAAAGEAQNWRSRLYAFGYDACQLTLALANARGAARSVLVAGLTGQLSFDGDGRVHRELLLAKLHKGEAQPTSDN